MTQESLQERYAPSSVCFGCGPANKNGLRIRSMVVQEEEEKEEEGGEERGGLTVVARWTPKPYHHAFGEFLNGGIISTILDCHSNWTAAYSLMVNARSEVLPATVTASFCVQFAKPTPLTPLFIEAHPSEITGRRVTVEATLRANEEVTAALRGTFVAVTSKHPAALRWTESGKHASGAKRMGMEKGEGS